MFLQKKSIIIFAGLVATLVLGGVWYAQIPAPATPPVVSGNGEQVIDKTDDGLSDGEVDTSVEDGEWRIYHNNKYNYTIKLPIEFENRSPYDTSLLEFNPSDSTINAVTEDKRVIGLAGEKRFITTTKGPTDRYKDLIANFKYEIKKIGDNEFTLLNRDIDFVKFFAVADNENMITIEFINIDDSVIQEVLESFQLSNG